MTIYNAVDEFAPNRKITREEAAKIFSNFAMNILCRVPNEDLSIDYTDVKNANTTLQPYIKLAYQL
jgi:hypothetical protein